jgi:thiol-disulfide isomerase/thioredoxin
MLVRLGIAIVLIAVSFGAYFVVTRWQTSSVAHKPAGAAVLSRLQTGIPAVVYFWSESCAPCKAVQSPAIKQLHAKLGSEAIQVIEINALENPEIADAWGVLSLPTTFIINAAGQPRHVNHGVARAEQLERQLLAFG